MHLLPQAAKAGKGGAKKPSKRPAGQSKINLAQSVWGEGDTPGSVREVALADKVGGGGGGAGCTEACGGAALEDMESKCPHHTPMVVQGAKEWAARRPSFLAPSAAAGGGKENGAKPPAAGAAAAASGPASATRQRKPPAHAAAAAAERDENNTSQMAKKPLDALNKKWVAARALGLLRPESLRQAAPCYAARNCACARLMAAPLQRPPCLPAGSWSLPPAC